MPFKLSFPQGLATQPELQGTAGLRHRDPTQPRAGAQGELLQEPGMHKETLRKPTGKRGILERWALDSVYWLYCAFYAWNSVLLGSPLCFNGRLRQSFSNYKLEFW